MSIQLGEHVVLETSHGLRGFAVSEPGNHVRLFKVNVDMGPLVGSPYGSVFELTQHAKIKLVNEPLLPDLSQLFDGLNEDNTDNREITDSNTSQAVSHDDIRKLREEGANAESIITALAKGSSTFKEKTGLSKQKWLLEKTKKYTRRFRVDRATSLTILEVLRAKPVPKLLNLRSDTLSQILLFSNAHAGGNLLAIDSTDGVIVGALAERMGCRGHLIVPHTKGSFPQQLLNRFNLEMRFVNAHSCADVSTEKSNVASSSDVNELPHVKSAKAAASSACEDIQQFLLTIPMDQLCLINEAFQNFDETESTAKRQRNEDTSQNDSSVTKSNCTSQLDHNGELTWSLPSKLPTVAESERLGYVALSEQDFLSGAEPNGASQENIEKSIDPQFCTKEPPQESEGLDVVPRFIPAIKRGASTALTPIVPRVKRLSALTETQRAVLFWQRYARRARRPKSEYVLGQLRVGLDGLVVVTDYHPLEVLLTAFRFLRPSRPFVVFSQQLQPLVDCFACLQQLRLATNIQLLDPFTREQQVLPKRTHPMMVMDGAAGYILTGISVVNRYTLTTPSPDVPLELFVS